MAKKFFLDNYQENAIKSEINTVVSAGAGSGKTKVLSERFTDLILNRGCKVDEILTLTFTKKATVEMSSRIYKVLKEKVPEQAKNFYKANIKTLDSYCNSIAKLGAKYYGITPDFSQNDDYLIETIKENAIPFILKNRNNIAIKALVETKDYSFIATELFINSILKNSTIVSPLDFDFFVKKQIDEIVFQWNNQLKNFFNTLDLLRNAYYSCEANKSTKFMQGIEDSLNPEKIPEFKELTKNHILNSDYKDFYLIALFFRNIAHLKPSGKNIDELKEIIYDMREPVKKLFALVNYIYGFSIIKNLIPLLKDFQDIINDIKRRLGILTFADISDLAVKILKDYPEIRQSEKLKYKAIMIDEFQDNNIMQRNLLFMLAEKEDRLSKGIPSVKDLCPNKLFFVGDEKQSIYRFRGADVSVFRALSEDFIDGNLSLSTNYRSHQSLIAAFNTIFGGFPFPPSSEDKKTFGPSVFFTDRDDNTNLPKFEAVYKEVTISKNAEEDVLKSSKNEIYAPHIHVARFNKDNITKSSQILEDEEAESMWVCSKIKELISYGVNGKIYKPEEIAILFKDYSLQPLYERTLLELGIPYNTETVTGLFSDGPINDIFSFLKICLYEKDTMSYAQILCSPFVNLSLEEANSIILLEEKPFDKKAVKLLSEDSASRYLHCKVFYEELKQKINIQSISQTITDLWYEAGYRYETLWNKKVNMYSKLYDLIFESACQAEQNNLSLSAYLDNMSQYQDLKKKLDNMDIPLEQSNGVHILSIHKSKGLEYKVVFVCATHKKKHSETNINPLYFSDEFGLSVNLPVCPDFNNVYKKSDLNIFFTIAKAENFAKETAELRRLVYVALTRAEEELYITNGKYSPSKDYFDYLPGSEKNPDCIYKILEPIFSYYEENSEKELSPFTFEEIYPQARNSSFINNSSERKNSFEQKINFIKEIIENEVYEIETLTKENISSKYVLPSHLYPEEDLNNEVLEEYQNILPKYNEINSIVLSTIPQNKTEEYAEPKFSFANFGTIAHAYMEAIIKKSEINISNKLFSGLENNTKKINTIKKICIEMQNDFISSDLGKDVLNSDWVKSEFDFRSRIDSKIIKGTMDLVYKNKDGTFTVVDFKTNQSIKPELYYNQLACYRQAISKMLGIEDEKTIKCSLFYLRFAKEIDITDQCNLIDVEKAIHLFEE
ncbi:MAG: UvrD-helicase domain-containing protein [Treponema sp.]|nr:UvrD-helicase domain-containing protein [Treponema sp.]MBP3608090.1 UvrD-helicase domain-containing protein [Treponema sp.]